MAKLTLLALAFAALVAIATAHTTIVTTTIEDDDNPISSQRQCSRQLQGHSLNQCRIFLQPGQIPLEQYFPGKQQQQQQSLQQCCQELQNIDEQCQCEAVKKVFREVQQQQQSRPFVGSQQTQQVRQKAQSLPNVCNLRWSRQCSIGSNFELPFLPWPFGTGSGSQQCRQSEIQRPVNQCQRFVQQQIGSPSWQGQQQQGQEQCCNELQNVRRECQCEAIKEVAKRVMQQQQTGQRGQQQMKTVRGVLQNLPNQCYLEVQQCNIPY